MLNFLVKLFIKDSDNISNPVVREKYGMFSSVCGIIVNIILSFSKYMIGVATNSVAITADAVNNLSDAASCIVTLFGFKMANQKPDKEHPFGHGRIEYIAALIVGFFIELMGYELIKSSIDKIRNPIAVNFSYPAVAVLVISILGKLWLAYTNKTLGKKIDSPAMIAVSKDSISDTFATALTLVSVIIAKFIDLPIDGYMGILVSMFIIYAGFEVLKETISIIIGIPPSKELVDKLVEFILSHEGIIGIHDLVIHSYGATNTFASIHTEVSAADDFIKIHDTVDLIERAVKEQFGIELVIHMDPVTADNERVNSLKETVSRIVKNVNELLTIHDFRIVDGPTHTNLIFDVVVPYDVKISNKELNLILNDKIKEYDSRLCTVITFDNYYI